MSDPSSVRVALVGLRHLHPASYVPHFRRVPGVEVSAVVEADQAVREAFCARHGVRGFDSIEALLQAQRPDIAAVFLPHDECADASATLAQAGVHLMVEKPFAHNTAAARRIRAAAREAGVQVTTGYAWRFHPATQVLRGLIADGALGEIVCIEGRCAAGRLERYIQGNSAWILERARSGGGCLFNLGVHWIDLARYLLGSEIIQVSGAIRSVNPRYDIEDLSLAHLRFGNHALMTLHVSYNVPPQFPHGRDLHIALYGTKGTASWSPAYEGARDRIILSSDGPSFQGAANREIELQLDPVDGYSGYMGAAYVEDFLAVVRGERSAPMIGADDAVAAIEAAEAVYTAADRGAWVDIPGNGETSR